MNKEIKKYTTPSGKVRYKFRMYMGKNETTGQSCWIKKRGFKTEKQAYESYLSYKLKVVKGEYVPANKRRLRVQDLYNKWVNVYETSGVQPSTLAVTKRYFKLHILKDLGNVYLDKLTATQCQDAVNKWYEVAPKTCKRFAFYTAKLFRYGINMDLMKDNPMKRVTVPKPPRDTDKFDEFYSKDELNKFLAAAKKYNIKYFTFFRVLAYSGMRKGEILALKWSDVDFKRKTIDINKSLSIDEDNHLYISPCKTRASVRTLSMDDETMNYLKEWRTRQQKDMFKLGLNFLSKDNLVFANTKGSFTAQSKPRRWNIAICKKYGLRRIKIHGFRHTHASLLFEAGAKMIDVKERLGHSDIKVTMNVYAHVTSGEAKKIKDNFDKFMES